MSFDDPLCLLLASAACLFGANFGALHPCADDEIIEELLNERHSMWKALSDLRAKYEMEKSPHLARMIEELEVEIARRNRGLFACNSETV